MEVLLIYIFFRFVRMRPLYFLLKLLLFYGIMLFFKKKRIVNSPKKFNAQTIFVVNHASAFLDPWVIAELQRPVLFFLARGDIFKKWLRPITWAAHMIPIYRTKENGADSAEKNEAIFREVYGLLKRKKSILIFGEGYTDDVFIRSLKSVKKGPARIGFGAMEATNWQQDIKIQCSGINYADPNKFRGEVLISNSEPIHLKDYEALYKTNSTKAILEITKTVSEKLQSQITYLNDPKLTDFHNHIQSITKKGIAHHNSNESIDLEVRWRYSQKLASFLNKEYVASDHKWIELKSTVATYFKSIKKEKIEDQWVLDFSNNKKPNFIARCTLLLICFPLFILGSFHHLIPYQLIKRFTEKTFKRKVFWSGIKFILGYFILAVFNIALCLLVNAYFELIHPGILWLYIILIVPPLGLVAYWFAQYFTDTIRLMKITKSSYEKWADVRKKCAQAIEGDIVIN